MLRELNNVMRMSDLPMYWSSLAARSSNATPLDLQHSCVFKPRADCIPDSICRVLVTQQMQLPL